MDFPNKQNPPAASAPIQGKVVKPVVSGVVQAPRPVTRRFMDFVFAESPKAISAKIGRDIVVPRAKAALEEAVGSFVKGMLWGGGQSPVSGIMPGTVLRGGTQLYHQVGQVTPAGLAAGAVVGRAPSGQYQDLICPTQQTAELLLAGMYDLFNQFHVVTVADLYELASKTPSGADGNYGWMSLEGARISKVREGYLLELPKPSLI